MQIHMCIRTCFISLLRTLNVLQGRIQDFVQGGGGAGHKVNRGGGGDATLRIKEKHLKIGRQSCSEGGGCAPPAPTPPPPGSAPALPDFVQTCRNLGTKYGHLYF